MILAKLRAFVVKDFIIESSYKVAFIISLINSIFPVLSYFFIDKLVAAESVQSLEKYGGDYFSFALVGIAFSSYFMMAVHTFSTTIRRAQMAGCLEAILSSQTSPKSIVLMSSVYSFLSAGVQLILIGIIGSLFFGFSFAQVNLPAALLVLFISVAIFVSLGIISAAGTIIFKQGEPFGWIIGSLGSILGGAFFPIEVMPIWLQKLSFIIPISHALDALRLTILQNYSIVMIGDKLLLLTGIVVVLFPLSLAFFNWSIEKGKKDGSLISY